MSADCHLAMINVGKMLGLRGDPVVQGFFDALDAVNALADASQGFVWRLVGAGNGLSRLWHLDPFGPTPHAFTFKLRFPPPGIGAPPVGMQPDPWCVGNA